MAFLPVNGDELLSPDGASKKSQRQLGCKILENLLQAGDLEETDIGTLLLMQVKERFVMPFRKKMKQLRFTPLMVIRAGKRKSSSSRAYARIRMGLLGSSRMKTLNIGG